MAYQNRYNLGRRRSVGMGVQTTEDTGVNASVVMRNQSFGLFPKPEFIKIQSAQGTNSATSRVELDQIISTGGIEGEIYIVPLGYELIAVMGSAPTTTKISNINSWKHLYKFNNSNDLHPGLTMYEKNEAETVRYVDTMVNTWNLNIARGETINRSADLIGRNAETANTWSPGVVDKSALFQSHQSYLQLATNESGLGSADKVPFTNLTMELTKNVQAIFTSARQDTSPTDIKIGETTLMLNFDLHFRNSTYKDKVLGNIFEAGRLTISNGLTGINLAQAVFQWKQAFYDGMERSNENADYSMLNVSAEVTVDDNSADWFTVELTNNKNSYV